MATFGKLLPTISIEHYYLYYVYDLKILDVGQVPDQISPNWFYCCWVRQKVERAQQEMPSSQEEPLKGKPPGAAGETPPS